MENLERRVESGERRRESRTRLRIPISFYPFTSHQSDTLSGQALNCSPGGMCFETVHPLAPNQCICLRTMGPAVAGAGQGQTLKSFTMAQVRWCAPKDPASPGGFFIGVKYL